MKKALIIIGEVVASFLVAVYVGLPLTGFVTEWICYYDKDAEIFIIFLIITISHSLRFVFISISG